MTLILFIVSVCVALILLGLSNYKYFNQEHIKDHPQASRKRSNAIALIKISSWLSLLGLLIIILIFLSVK